MDVFAHFFCVALRKESVDRNVDTPFAADRSGWSLSARRAWIEIVDDALEREVLQSLSARRAWIEIHDGYSNPIYSQVALRKESVDRNLWVLLGFFGFCVALRKESVDRNLAAMSSMLSDAVALRKESVDRN